MIKSKLWHDHDKNRYFIIPDNKKLPYGKLVLYTIAGHQKRVDPKAITPFEISSEEAKEWLKTELGGILGELKGGLVNAFSRLAQKPKEERVSSVSSKKVKTNDNNQSSSTPPTQPGLTLFAALTGESAESLNTDTVALQRGLRTLTKKLGSIATEFMSTDDTKLKSAQDDFHHMFSTLREHGIPVSDSAEEIPLRIREQLRSNLSDEQVELGADRLDALAKWLEETAAEAASELRKVAAQWRTTHKDNPSKNPKEHTDETPTSSYP